MNFSNTEEKFAMFSANFKNIIRAKKQVTDESLLNLQEQKV
jgi:hypothetical protein